MDPFEQEGQVTAPANRRRLLLSITLAFLVVATGPAVAQVGNPAVVPAPPETGVAYEVNYFDVSAGATAQASAAMQAYVAASRREPGAEDVRLLGEVARPNRFLVLERWSDGASQAAHDQGEARRRLLSALAGGLLAPPDLRSHREFLGAPLPPAKDASALYVMTHIDVTPRVFAPLVEMLRPYVSDVQTRRGVEGFQVLQHVAPRQNHLTVLEIWRDAASFEAHRASAPAKQFRGTIDPILAALYDERLYRTLR